MALALRGRRLACARRGRRGAAAYRASGALVLRPRAGAVWRRGPAGQAAGVERLLRQPPVRAHPAPDRERGPGRRRAGRDRPRLAAQPRQAARALPALLRGAGRALRRHRALQQAAARECPHAASCRIPGCRRSPRPLTTPGGDVEIILVHLPSPTDAALVRRRDHQAAMLARHVRALGRPTVVAGDFNMSMWSRGYRPLEQVGGLANARAGHGVGPTWPAIWRARRADRPHPRDGRRAAVRLPRASGRRIGSLPDLRRHQNGARSMKTWHRPAEPRSRKLDLRDHQRYLPRHP